MWTKEDEECFCITLDTPPQFSKIRVDGFMIGRRYVELDSLSNLKIFNIWKSKRISGGRR